MKKIIVINTMLISSIFSSSHISRARQLVQNPEVRLLRARLEVLKLNCPSCGMIPDTFYEISHPGLCFPVGSNLKPQYLKWDSLIRNFIKHVSLLEKQRDAYGHFLQHTIDYKSPTAQYAYAIKKQSDDGIRILMGLIWNASEEKQNCLHDYQKSREKHCYKPLQKIEDELNEKLRKEFIEKNFNKTE